MSSSTNTIDLTVHGLKDGWQVFFTSDDRIFFTPDNKVKDIYKHIISDKRGLVTMNRPGCKFYSIQFSEGKKVFSLYRTILDYHRRPRAYYAISLHIPPNTNIKGSVTEVLNDLNEVFEQKYLDNQVLELAPEKKNLFLDIIKKVSDSKLIKIGSTNNNWQANPKGKPAYIYCDYKTQVNKFFDNPYLPKIQPHSEVFLLEEGKEVKPGSDLFPSDAVPQARPVDIDFRIKDKTNNPVNAEKIIINGKHSYNTNSTGKINIAEYNEIKIYVKTRGFQIFDEPYAKDSIIQQSTGGIFEIPLVKKTYRLTVELRDDNRKVIKGANIKLLKDNIGFPPEKLTDSNGKVVFDGLDSVDTLKVKPSKIGYSNSSFIDVKNEKDELEIFLPVSLKKEPVVKQEAPRSTETTGKASSLFEPAPQQPKPQSASSAIIEKDVKKYIIEFKFKNTYDDTINPQKGDIIEIDGQIISNIPYNKRDVKEDDTVVIKYSIGAYKPDKKRIKISEEIEKLESGGTRIFYTVDLYTVDLIELPPNSRGTNQGLTSSQQNKKESLSKGWGKINFNQVGLVIGIIMLLSTGAYFGMQYLEKNKELEETQKMLKKKLNTQINVLEGISASVEDSLNNNLEIALLNFDEDSLKRRISDVHVEYNNKLNIINDSINSLSSKLKRDIEDLEQLRDTLPIIYDINEDPDTIRIQLMAILSEFKTSAETEIDAINLEINLAENREEENKRKEKLKKLRVEISAYSQKGEEAKTSYIDKYKTEVEVNSIGFSRRNKNIVLNRLKDQKKMTSQIYFYKRSTNNTDKLKYKNELKKLLTSSHLVKNQKDYIRSIIGND